MVYAETTELSQMFKLFTMVELDIIIQKSKD